MIDELAKVKIGLAMVLLFLVFGVGIGISFSVNEDTYKSYIAEGFILDLDNKVYTVLIEEII